MPQRIHVYYTDKLSCHDIIRIDIKMLWFYFDFTDNDIIYVPQTSSTDGVSFFTIQCALDNVDFTCCPF